jgi:hypothetical protein
MIGQYRPMLRDAATVRSGDGDFDASGCTVIFSLWVARRSVWSDQEQGVKPWHRVVKSC